MCVPIPVDKSTGAPTGGNFSSRNVNPKGRVTGGFPQPQLDIVNQMMTPFRRAAKGTTPEEQRARFADPKSMAALLTPPDIYNQQRQDQAAPGYPAVPPGAGKRDLTEEERRRYIGRARVPDTGGVTGTDMQTYVNTKGWRPY